MKIALAIYMFMLALEGGLAWHAGGSPYLLAATMLVVLVSALFSIRPRQAAGFSSLIIQTLVVILSPLYYGNDPNVLWLCLLALPHLLSATQCISEIQYSGATRDVSGINIKLFIFTLGFYATMGLAFLMLRADLLKMERSTGVMLAVVITLLGLVAWEVGRVGRLKKGKAVDPLSGSELHFRSALSGLVLVVFALLFAVALPLVSDALCGFSARLKLPSNLPDSSPRQMPATLTGKSGGIPSDDESGSDAGPEMTNRTGQSRLPMRGTFELSDEVRVVLKFENSTELKSLTQRGPIYVQTRAVSKFKDDQWVSEISSGSWVNDAADGKLDGKVEVSKPSPGEIAHEVFIPQSNGYALPALSGVTTYALPELFVRPDNWFQNTATGDIRYKAWSKPVNILSLSHLKLEAGNPGEAYFNKLSTPFGTRLTETAELFRTKRKDLSGRLELLHQYFQAEFKYSMTIENKSGIPPLENFLFHEKKGYCDFFASAAALILRHMDIPSRVAYGYKEGEHDVANDTWIFREYHAHAWTEIFVKDHGWVICDFTPPSPDATPRSGTPPPFDIANFKTAGESNTKAESKLWNKSESLRSLGYLWVPAFLGLGLLGALVSFLLRKRHTPQQRAAEKTARERAKRDQQPDYFLEFLRMCKFLGHHQSEGQTLMEFHRHLKHSQFCNDDFEDLVAYYYKSRYEDAPQDVPRERGFLNRIREFRKTNANNSPSRKGIFPRQSGEA